MMTKVIKNREIGKAKSHFLMNSLVMETFLTDLLVSSTSSTDMNCGLSCYSTCMSLVSHFSLMTASVLFQLSRYMTTQMEMNMA